MSTTDETAELNPILSVVPTEPTPPAEDRITSLDLVRGIAILGILPVNMAFFMNPTDGLSPAQPPIQWPGDPVIGAQTLFFFSGKMITQLAILFGAGLAIQSDRAAAAERPFVGYYLWRMFLLLLIGLAHTLFLWYGDILTSYALVGAAALMFRRLSQRAVHCWMVGFLVLVYLILAGMASLPWLIARFAPELAQEAKTEDKPPVETQGRLGVLAPYMGRENELRIYRDGPWRDMVVNRAIHFGIYLMIFAIWVFWDLLACFLLGAYLLRRGVFADVAAHRVFLRRLIVFGLVIGLPLHVAAVTLAGANPLESAAMFLNTAGALPQAVAYLGLTLFWSSSEFAPRLQARLRAVGRMALTNYLLQSVLCGLVFYGYGLGLFGEYGHTFGFGVALSIWLLELAWSPLWLRYFTSGPVEWLWRCLADGRVRPLRRTAGVAV